MKKNKGMLGLGTNVAVGGSQERKIDFFAAWFHHVSQFVNLVKRSSINLKAPNQRVKHTWYIQRKVETSRSVDHP
jgi:hypothetical protein